MAERGVATEKPNGGIFVEVIVDGEEGVNLYTVLHRLIAAIFFPISDASYASTPPPLLHRIKASLSDNIPILPEASRNTGRDILLWTRRGTPLRALLVVSVGTITLLSLTGLLLFTVFIIAATFNAILISLLMSLAAAGGFLALFFACVTTIYVGALAVAVFVISSMTIVAIIAVLIAAGWIGFFWTLWFATRKSVGLAQHSLSMSRSALSAYSSARHARHARHHQQPNKVSD